MECYVCKRTIFDVLDEAMYPLDPKGTKDRRWAHEGCMNNEQYNSVADEVRDLVENVKAYNSSVRGGK